MSELIFSDMNMFYILPILAAGAVSFYGFCLWDKYKKGYSTDAIGPILWFDGFHNLSKRKNPTKEATGLLRYWALVYMIAGVVMLGFVLNEMIRSLWR